MIAPAPTTPRSGPAQGRTEAHGAHRRRTKRLQQGVLATFAVPALVLFLVFNLVPILSVFYISMTSYGGILSKPEWLGFDNYARLLDEKDFWKALRVSGIQVVVLLPSIMLLSFALGYYLTTLKRGASALRIILFVPSLISLAGKAMLYMAFLAPNGILNGALKNLGLKDWALPWFADQRTALPTLLVIAVWNTVAFQAVLFNARLSGIDREILAAAEVDGAGYWTRMWHICLPISWSYFGVLAMLQYLAILFGSAAEILLLTGGGPAGSTTSLSFLLYVEAFSRQNIGFSQTVGVVLFLLGVLGMVLLRAIFRSKVD